MIANQSNQRHRFWMIWEQLIVVWLWFDHTAAVASFEPLQCKHWHSKTPGKRVRECPSQCHKQDQVKWGNSQRSAHSEPKHLCGVVFNSSKHVQMLVNKTTWSHMAPDSQKNQFDPVPWVRHRLLCVLCKLKSNSTYLLVVRNDRLYRCHVKHQECP